MAFGLVDRFGYYEVNNQTFLTKQWMMHEHLKSKKSMQYIFNDDVFSCYNWTVEPEPNVSLWEFYRRRAQQLRDNYDYLILQYSGGPDSHNMLEVFLRNNIKIDEIVNINSYDKTQVTENTLNNADYFYNAKPVLEEFLKRNHSSDTRITILDEIDITNAVWLDHQKRDTQHEILQGNSWFASNWIFKGIWIKHVKHIWDRVLAGQRVGLVMGMDKTVLMLDEKNLHYTVFSDNNGPDTGAVIMYDPDLRGTNPIEWFYHTPDMPELSIKQAHVLKKTADMAIATDFEEISHFKHKSQRTPFTCKSKIHPGNLKYDLYHKAVYPFWRPNIVTPKPMYTGTRLQDNWWATQLPNEFQKAWRHGFVHMLRNFKELIPMHQNKREIGNLPMVLSRKYYLE